MSRKMHRILSDLARELQAAEGPEFHGDFGDGYEAAAHSAGSDLQQILIEGGAWDNPLEMTLPNNLESDLKALLLIWEQVAKGQVQILKAPEEAKGFRDCARQAHQALSDVMRRHGVLK